MAKARSDRFVDTAGLARELHITPRRTNQLLAEHILPPPRGEDGLHDVDLAAARYRLFRDGEPGDFEDFLRDLPTGRAEALLRRALLPTSTWDECRQASLAVQEAAVGLRFFAACKIPEALRPMHHAVHTDKESLALGAIVKRCSEIVAADNGLTPAEVLAGWTGKDDRPNRAARRTGSRRKAA